MEISQLSRLRHLNDRALEPFLDNEEFASGAMSSIEVAPMLAEEADQLWNEREEDNVEGSARIGSGRGLTKNDFRSEIDAVQSRLNTLEKSTMLLETQVARLKQQMQQMFREREQDVMAMDQLKHEIQMFRMDGQRVQQLAQDAATAAQLAAASAQLAANFANQMFGLPRPNATNAG
eukprot:TRINITY_DN4361_c0_g2_i1.p2 TRINITY_DN4361_c0_g2~~TRINITY_DN4361_c0_g2_i1.p2  ORF type:complete len:177 (-),score=35.61 TRINITY_DN4361_c0_g2_i1:402-932(-)